MTPEFIMHLLWSRRWLILVVTLVTMASAWWWAETAEPQYKATTTLVLSFNEGGPFEDTGTVNRQQQQSFLTTQIDIINSRRIARDALGLLSREHLEQLSSEFMPTFDARRVETPELIAALEGYMLENLEVDAMRESRVVALRYTSTSRETAAAVSQAFADAYLDVSLKLDVEPAQRNAEWFDDQLVRLRERLAEKQAILTAYQREKGIITDDDRLDQEISRYESLAEDHRKAQARTIEVRASQLGSQHPEYRRAIQQEQALAARLAEQSQRVFAVKEQRDELELLAQDVENARRTYDIAMQEFYSNSMKSQFNRSSASILNPATPPGKSLESSAVVRALGAAILGLFLGVGLAIVAELLNRKIRTEEDIVDGLELPVIASI